MPEIEDPTAEDVPEAEVFTDEDQPDITRFGTFAGVFTPTLLTILGVILFLREGWVVGNAGLLGAWLVITLSFVIVTFTALSMSSITTNIRIGAGGAYSIISQSLGLEVGGSVGVPLYLAQALAVSMYVFGFREGVIWAWTQYGSLPLALSWMQLAVDLGTFAVLFAIAYVSTSFAFRVQYVILVLIIVSLVSIGATVFMPGTFTHSVTWWGSFPGSLEEGFPGISFWGVFAVFFPAATGIMAGANMSGVLKNPRRSIPVGTLSAIGISYVIYMAIAYWLARVGSVQELISNYTLMIDRALWGPAVLAGLLGATFSSGLASFVGAPKILRALGNHDIIPGSDWIRRLSPSGEPHNAMFVSGLLVFAALMMRDLNAVAPLITMFFLITYTMINLVVLVEQRLDMVSFRPALRVPITVPALGTLGCLFAMFIVNATFSLVAFGIVLALYFFLVRRKLDARQTDIRSGLFRSIGEWIARHVSQSPWSEERAWKPNLLVPVESSRELRGGFTLIRNLTYPNGTIKLVGISSDWENDPLAEQLSEQASFFRGEGVMCQSMVIESDSYARGVISSVQILTGTFFSPNNLFLRLPAEEEREDQIREITRKTRAFSMGLMIFAPDPVAQLGRRSTINVWLSNLRPGDANARETEQNFDLPLLSAHMLRKNWNGELNVITCVEDTEDRAETEDYLRNLLEQARLPEAQPLVYDGDFRSGLVWSPQSDLDVFGLGTEPDFNFMRKMVEKTESACLFVRDSGQENVLA